MRPGTDGKGAGCVDQLLGAVIDLDRKPRLPVRAVLCREEHVRGGAGAEIEDAGPGIQARRFHPCADGEIIQRAHQPRGQRGILRRCTRESDRVVELARCEHRTVDKRRIKPATAGVGGGRAVSLVELEVDNQGVWDYGDLGGVRAGAVGVGTTDDIVVGNVIGEAGVGVRDARHTVGNGGIGAAARGGAFDGVGGGGVGIPGEGGLGVAGGRDQPLRRTRGGIGHVRELGRTQRGGVDAEVVEGAVEVGVGELRLAEVVLRGEAEVGGAERGGAGAGEGAIDIERNRASGAGDGDVGPNSRGQGNGAVDVLFDDGRGADGEAEAAGAGGTLRGEEHIIVRSGAEIEDALPGGEGVHLDPRGDGEIGQAAGDAGRECGILGGCRGQIETAVEDAGGEACIVDERGMLAAAAGIGGDDAADFVKLQVGDQGARADGDLGGVGSGAVGIVRDDDVVVGVVMADARVGVGRVRQAGGHRRVGAAAGGRALDAVAGRSAGGRPTQADAAGAQDRGQTSRGSWRACQCRGLRLRGMGALTAAIHCRYDVVISRAGEQAGVRVVRGVHARGNDRVGSAVDGRPLDVVTNRTGAGRPRQVDLVDGNR